MVYLTGARLARLSGKKAVKTEKTSMLGKKNCKSDQFFAAYSFAARGTKNLGENTSPGENHNFGTPYANPRM